MKHRSYKESVKTYTTYRSAGIGEFVFPVREGTFWSVSYQEYTMAIDDNGDQISLTQQGAVGSTLNDENKDSSFPILKEGSMDPSGSEMTVQELYNAVTSYYHHLAAIRDEKEDELENASNTIMPDPPDKGPEVDAPEPQPIGDRPPKGE